MSLQSIGSSNVVQTENSESLLSSDAKSGLQNIIDRVAKVVKEAILERDEDCPNEYLSPISCGFIQVAVTTSCNHSFDRDELASWFASARAKNCPLCRGDLEGQNINPNEALQLLIDQWKAKEVIPRLLELNEYNLSAFQEHLVAARRSAAEGKTEEAIISYTEAFKYSDSAEDYKEVIRFFESISENEKAALACLYLAKYLINGSKLEEAVEILEKYKNLTKGSCDIDNVLIILYRAVGQDEVVDQVSDDETEWEGQLQLTPSRRVEVLRGNLISSQRDDTHFTSVAIYRTLEFARRFHGDSFTIRRALEFINHVAPAIMDEDGNEIARNNNERNAMEARIQLNTRLGQLNAAEEN